MATFPTVSWDQYQAMPPAARRRPLTLAELNGLTPVQLSALGLGDQTEGAPAGFSGPVFPNPDHIRPQLDTDKAPLPKLPNGVKASLVADQQPAVDYEALAAKHGGTAVVDYDALAQKHGGSAVAESTPAAVAGEAPQPGWLDQEIPLTSYGAAMESGAQSIARGVRGAVQGTIAALDPRAKDEHEQAVVKAAGSPTILPVYRLLRSLGHTAEDSLQIAGAIHDINQSQDPTGAYLKVAQETAGEGAGQALTALATEGAVKAAPKVLEAVTPSNVKATVTAPVRLAARGAETALNQKIAPIKPILKVMTPADEAEAIHIKVPGRDYGLPKPAAEPAPAAAAAAPVEAPKAAPAAEAPAPAPAPKPKITPAKVEADLQDALGAAKPNVQPGKPIAQKPLTTAAKPAAAAELPADFTPVKSSVMAGYKYDPATHEFEAITNTGARYRAGEVSHDQFAKFEAADSKGTAWNELRRNSTPLGKYVKGEYSPYTKPGLRSADPNDLAAAEAGVEVTPKPKGKSMKDLSGTASSGDEDLTAQLQQSVEQAKAKAPRYVYRARDVGEEGIPLKQSHAQAGTDLKRIQKYAEAGQRNASEEGEVIRVDLSKLKPSDYILKSDPSGTGKWVQFTRPLSETEVEVLTSKRAAAKK